MKKFLIFLLCSCALLMGVPSIAAQHTASDKINLMLHALNKREVVSMKFVALNKGTFPRYAMTPDRLELNSSRKFWFYGADSRELCDELSVMLTRLKFLPHESSSQSITMGVTLYGLNDKEIGTIFLSENGKFGFLGSVPFLIEFDKEKSPLLTWFIRSGIWSE